MTSPAAELLYRELRQGQDRALSRALSWIENGAPQAAALLERAQAEGALPWVVGITGPSGAGKSSLVPHLAARLVAAGSRVAVFALDPSSARTGGALLGDRVRLPQDGQGAGVFYRSVASRGPAGTRAASLRGWVRIAGAAGYDAVLLETEGSGQPDAAVLDLVHTVLLVTAPGLGDELQARKAGLVEVAHVLVVNQADRPGWEETLQALQQAVRLAAGEDCAVEGRNESPDGALRWLPPVLPASALTRHGVAELADWLNEHRRFLADGAGRAAGAHPRARPIRVVLTKIGLDGPDHSAKAMAQALRDAGMEVIYAGLRRNADDIARIVLEEDADVLGLSILSGAVLPLARRVCAALHERQVDDVVTLVDGIVPATARPGLAALGVHGVFAPGAPLQDIVGFIRTHARRERAYAASR